MKVNQIYEIINDVTKEVLGEKSITVAEDLSNIVDVGKEILNGADIDNYVKSLVDHIGRVIFVNRKYSGGAPSVLMDGWEFGSILEKITADLPEATENESWELENGTVRDFPCGYAKYRAIKEHEAAQKQPAAAEKKEKKEKPKTSNHSKVLEKKLRFVEREIEKQEALIAELDTKIEGSGADYQELTRLLGEKETAENDLMILMEQWEAAQEGME